MGFPNEKCVKNSDLLAGIHHTVTALTSPNQIYGFKSLIFIKKIMESELEIGLKPQIEIVIIIGGFFKIMIKKPK